MGEAIRAKCGKSMSASPFTPPGAGHLYLPEIRPTGSVGFDERSERNAVMTYNPDKRTWELKEGATRAQAEMFYKRLEAVKVARAMLYVDKRTRIADLLNFWFERGYSTIERRGRYYYFINGMEELRLHVGAERDYIMTLLDFGTFKKNYGSKLWTKN